MKLGGASAVVRALFARSSPVVTFDGTNWSGRHTTKSDESQSEGALAARNGNGRGDGIKTIKTVLIPSQQYWHHLRTINTIETVSILSRWHQCHQDGIDTIKTVLIL